MIVILILGIYYETVATTANNVVASSIAALAPNKEGGIGVVNTTSFDRCEVVELPAGVRTPQVSHDGKPLGMPERVRG